MKGISGQHTLHQTTRYSLMHWCFMTRLTLCFKRVIQNRHRNKKKEKKKWNKRRSVVNRGNAEVLDVDFFFFFCSWKAKPSYIFTRSRLNRRLFHRSRLRTEGTLVSTSAGSDDRELLERLAARYNTALLFIDKQKCTSCLVAYMNETALNDYQIFMRHRLIEAIKH